MSKVVFAVHVESELPQSLGFSAADGERPSDILNAEWQEAAKNSRSFRQFATSAFRIRRPTLDNHHADDKE